MRRKKCMDEEKIDTRTINIKEERGKIKDPRDIPK
jgi:hypothetical protein